MFVTIFNLNQLNNKNKFLMIEAYMLILKNSHLNVPDYDNIHCIIFQH